MSTRGYFGIKKKGELKGSYNHFDSYFSGLGVDLVRTINEIDKEERLAVLDETFDYIKLVDSDTKPNNYQKNICKNANVVDLSVSNRSLDDWYCLLRKVQGDLKAYINKVVPYMENGNDFIEDTLFCEYAYIINLDTNKFEVIYGWQNRIKKEFDLLDLKEEDLLDLEENED